VKKEITTLDGRSFIRRGAPIAVAIFLIWLTFVVVQGILAASGLSLLEVDFEITGQFGDSFGFFSAIMASAAALGAWAAVSEQGAALAASEDAAIRLEESARKRDFEATFFNLLSTFLRLGEGIDVGSIFSKKAGKDAFSQFVREVYAKKEESDPNFETAYLLVFLKYQDDLAHYIRNIYNIIHFIKESCPDEPYFYARLLRSTLSQPELVILALNGMFHDEGRRNFKPLIEEFALLNNISDQAKADFDLEDHFESSAFRSPKARLAAAGVKNGEQ
jgi:transcription antitermination factor NusG